jgi:hypothetical protein
MRRRHRPATQSNLVREHLSPVRRQLWPKEIGIRLPHQEMRFDVEMASPISVPHPEFDQVVARLPAKLVSGWVHRTGREPRVPKVVEVDTLPMLVTEELDLGSPADGIFNVVVV